MNLCSHDLGHVTPPSQRPPPVAVVTSGCSRSLQDACAQTPGCGYGPDSDLCLLPPKSARATPCPAFLQLFLLTFQRDALFSLQLTSSWKQSRFLIASQAPRPFLEPRGHCLHPKELGTTGSTHVGEATALRAPLSPVAMAHPALWEPAVLL